jgi:hypothetical protein
MSCPHFSGCALYPRFKLAPLLRLWQVRYCEADHTRCARYQLSLAGKPVPLTLLPNGQHLGAARAEP